jgi:hypothetical protein
VKDHLSTLSTSGELSERFGTEIVTGSTSDYQGYVLIMGHRVLDETRSIEQYGYQAILRFVLVDRMVYNGYSSWFWDGKAMIGGWATASTIFQVSGGLNQRPSISGGCSTISTSGTERRRLSRASGRRRYLGPDNLYVPATA